METETLKVTVCLQHFIQSSKFRAEEWPRFCQLFPREIFDVEDAQNAAGFRIGYNVLKRSQLAGETLFGAKINFITPILNFLKKLFNVNI